MKLIKDVLKSRKISFELIKDILKTIKEDLKSIKDVLKLIKVSFKVIKDILKTIKVFFKSNKDNFKWIKDVFKSTKDNLKSIKDDWKWTKNFAKTQDIKKGLWRVYHHKPEGFKPAYKRLWQLKFYLRDEGDPSTPVAVFTFSQYLPIAKPHLLPRHEPLHGDIGHHGGV